ncbi:MAG: DUF4442 domain-containing protein [Arachidicoccus sp.]|nr:DUF4442 domain-containing protein [Arachidicoccus sp.]
MIPLSKYLDSAGASDAALSELNNVLWTMVPFNKPHELKIIRVEKDGITIGADLISSNENHIKGIHACVLAALCEYVVGINLLTRISQTEYRLIMKNLNMEYHYQAKSSVKVKWTLSDEELSNQILEPLKENDVVFCTFQTEVFDTDGNHICTGKTNWQIKAWNKVNSKI